MVPVSVVVAEPREKSKLCYNATLQSQVISLGGTRYRDLDGNVVQGSITLEPFMSRILVADTGAAAVGRQSRQYLATPGVTVSRRAGSRSLAIAVTTDRQDRLSVSVHDLAGRRVAVIYRGVAQAGAHSLSWDRTHDKGAGICRGTYLLRVEIGDRVYLAGLVDVR